LICRIASWIIGKPIVVFGHSGPGADDKWNLLCSPNVFVAFSNYQKLWAERHKLPWTKVVKISHAVDTDMFTPADKKPRNKLVLCVAADSPSKRVDLVRKACDEAGFNFLAVGKGQEKEAPHEQMPKIYKEADIFCFVPESWEAFGLVFLEALSSNLPVVTVDDPVRREIVNHAGVFVKDPKNIEHLASAIEIAYKMKWGSRPRVQAEKFSWEKIEKKYIQFFNDLNHK
jgi:glycosyltransferase involved in cell wall biosynthesis